MPTAVITGASRGLGRALAMALAADGWSLVIDARGSLELERTARALGRLGPVVALAGDVSRAAALTEGFQRAFALGAAFAFAGSLVSLLVVSRVRVAR